LLRLRVAAIHEGFAYERARLAGGMKHRFGFKGGQPHRLLDQHMLAGFRCLDRPFGMARMRGRDVDRVHLSVGQQRFVAVMDACAGEILGEVRFAGIAGPYGDELAGP
jgi:hypothetical protein